ncbi:hypothetical protein BH11BAC5_BH11BAC5_33350 [soil metagenome]|jgi:hypothetical protein
MRKVFFIAAITLLVSATAFGQRGGHTDYNTSDSYTTAVGVKFYPGALTIKHFVNDNTALEGLAYFWNRGARITGLYEIHGNINGVDGLKWYIGPGAHVGFYNTKYGGGSSVGVDGVLGLDYKIEGAPINLSLDWQPSFEFGNNYGNGFSGNWGGFAIRYTF